MARRTYTFAEGVARRLTDAREARGIRIRDLARAAMVDPRTVTNLLRGNIMNPGAATLVDLARALDVRAAWLILGDGAMDRA